MADPPGLAFAPPVNCGWVLARPSGGLECPVRRRELLHLLDGSFIKWVVDVAEILACSELRL